MKSLFSKNCQDNQWQGRGQDGFARRDLDKVTKHKQFSEPRDKIQNTSCYINKYKEEGGATL